MSFLGRARVALFIPFLLVTSHAWVLFYRPKELDSLLPFLSFACLQLVLWTGCAVVDQSVRGARPRFILGGLATLLCGFVLADALLLRATGMPSVEALPLIWKGHHPWDTLREIGLLPRHILMGFGALFGAFVCGGIASRGLDRFRLPAPSAKCLACAGVGFSILFVTEQIWSRNRPDYLYRGFSLPAYPQLFSSNDDSIRIDLPDLMPAAEKRNALSGIRASKVQPDVVFILLESFRRDVLDPKVTPNLSRIQSESLDFPEARAEANFTPLAWNVLFADQPAYKYLFQFRPGTNDSMGGWNLAVLHQVGYEIGLSVASDMTYEAMDERVLGDRSIVDRFFSSAAAGIRRRYLQDVRATDELVSWMSTRDDPRPFFYLLQLDSTHWTYEFDEEHPLVTPFSEFTESLRPVLTEDGFRLLHNRYVNAAHYVDGQIGRILAVLDARDEYENTVFVVVADHGEGFLLGHLGHGTLHEDTLRIPLFLKLPGVAPRSVPFLASTRDVFPSLFDYLGLQEALPHSIGSSLLRGTSEEAVLAFHGYGWRAKLILPDYDVHMRVAYNQGRAAFTPFWITDRSGRVIPEWQTRLEGIQLEQTLIRLTSTHRAASSVAGF